MSVFEFILLLLVAGITGSIGQALSGYTKGGCVLSIIVGFIGALLGTWLSRQLHLPEFFVLDIGDVAFPIVWAVIGGTLFTGILNLLSAGKKS